MIYLRLLREFFLSVSQRWTEYIFAEPPLFGPGLSRLGSGFMIQNHFRGSNSKTAVGNARCAALSLDSFRRENNFQSNDRYSAGDAAWKRRLPAPAY